MMIWPGRRARRDEALLAAVARRLRDAARSVEPSAEFRSSLRTFLMMDAATSLVRDPSRPGVPPPPSTRARPRRRMIIATAFVGTALGLGGVSSASASALPGDTLYPVKRATEQVELSFHRDLADRGAFQLELAERRLDEARQLSERGPGSADLAAETVRDFEKTAAAGTANLMAAYRQDHSRSSIVALNQFTARTGDLLESLESRLPGEATAAVDDARDRLEAIDNRTGELCPSCGGASNGGSGPAPQSDGSSGVAPEPSSQPQEPPSEEPPSVEPPAEPPVAVPPDNSSDVSDFSDFSDNQDTSDDNSDSDSQSQKDEPPPAMTPEPVPTPTPTEIPTPMPTPTPEPTPSPEPVPEPTPSLLNIVPAAVQGVAGVLSALL
jgi:hypothetical protein